MAEDDFDFDDGIMGWASSKSKCLPGGKLTKSAPQTGSEVDKEGKMTKFKTCTPLSCADAELRLLLLLLL